LSRELVLTAGAVAAAVGGKLVGGDASRTIAGFSIDSRTLASGDLFFVIRGERFDGHVFVADAIRAGAAGVVISDPTAAPVAEGTAIVLVDDTIRALQALGSHVRSVSGTKVVAVTGSAGKSTTKEIAAEFLSARYQVFRNKGNLNNHIGLPLSLLELRRRPDIAVVEFGMNHFGEIRTLVGIAQPDVRVWTNVGPAHLEFFGTVDAVAEAKAEILEGAGREHVLIANADDERVMAHARRFAGHVVTFGLERPADVRAVAVRDRGIDGMSARVRTPVGQGEVDTPLAGIGNLANLLAATAVALRFDVPLGDVLARAATLKPVSHRGEVIRAGRVTILDDSYNSNPAALSRALAVMKGESRFARRIAVIGEMLELGEGSIGLHRESGEEAASSDLSALVTVGGAPARALAEAAVSAGMSRDAVFYVEDSARAASLLLDIVKPGDLVLVKGSRGVRVEVVVARLRAELN
jgi:UDP-N-acetylmuramoyl-tripeptide--D-alanyl-D-alanine ligase